MKRTTCFDVFGQCVRAIQQGELIKSESEKDKEFHFQNWFGLRLKQLRIHFDEPGRNTYPDFRLVKFTEGYEVKGLKWPGRDTTYDSNMTQTVRSQPAIIMGVRFSMLWQVSSRPHALSKTTTWSQAVSSR